jgi:thiol-disulfide isomerase/thioredoxin
MLILFVFTGCEEKTNKQKNIPVENTTEVIKEEVHKQITDDRFKVPAHTQTVQKSKNKTSFNDIFTLSNIKNKRYTVYVSDKKVTFKENTKPIVLITFFASWCPPCLYEIPYFNDLQKKYQTHLFLAGVLVHDTMNISTIKSFLAKYNIKYYISNGTQNNDFANLTAKILHLPHNFPIPLTIMYVNNKYFTHYEGIVPIEMIEYDIEEALKTLKGQ